MINYAFLLLFLSLLSSSLLYIFILESVLGYFALIYSVSESKWRLPKINRQSWVIFSKTNTEKQTADITSNGI